MALNTGRSGQPTQNPGGRFGTAFMDKIDARSGITTGISAADRAHTIQAAARDDCRPGDMVRGAGHVDTLRAQPGEPTNRE